MGGRPPIYTEVREHIERGVELIEEAMRDGRVCPREQVAIHQHHTVTLGIAEEHEFTSRLAQALTSGGLTKRTYYGAKEYDRTYGTGELTEKVA